MNRGKYYSDITTCSQALQTRLSLNRQLGVSDFDGWVLGQLQPKQGECILDVGCGTGKFAIPCAQVVGDKVSVTALDVSQESLAKLKAQCQARALRIKTICARMEELTRYVGEGIFDAILSSYALYYSEKPEQTIHDVCRCLKREGRLLVVSPDQGNNQEFLSLLEPITGIPETAIYNQSFTYKIVTPVCKTLFKELREEHFENSIIFPNAQLLLKYWRSGGYYHAETEEFVRKAVASYFSEHSEFILHKRAVSVLAVGVKA